MSFFSPNFEDAYQSRSTVTEIFLLKLLFLSGGAENFYCYGEGFVKVLMQDYGLLHGVIAFVRTHSHA